MAKVFDLPCLLECSLHTHFGRLQFFNTLAFKMPDGSNIKLISNPRLPPPPSKASPKAPPTSTTSATTKSTTRQQTEVPARFLHESRCHQLYTGCLNKPSFLHKTSLPSGFRNPR